MKFVLVPDSFKGTLSSQKVCEIMRRAVLEEFEDAEVVSIPIADGGEGTVEAVLQALDGKVRSIPVKGPHFEEETAAYGILRDGKTAIIESAAACGLPLVGNARNPEKTTTYGVGQLILDAIKEGCDHIILGLGGSSTNDFGCGLAAALGVRFTNTEGEYFIPVGGTLSSIKSISLSGIPDVVKKTKFTLMCDVNNPLYGPNGAAYVYAPQKGATQTQVLELDAGLRHVANLVKELFGIDVSQIPGAGAAGGIAGGMLSFFETELKMGIDTILDLVHFEEVLKGTQCVFTGEGKIDTQSSQGKVISGICRRLQPTGIPLIAVVGGIEGDLEELYRMGLTAVFSINRLPQDFSISKYQSEENLFFAMKNILKMFKTSIAGYFPKE